MLITELNGKRISGLDDFAAAAEGVAPGSAGYVVARDLSSTASPIGDEATDRSGLPPSERPRSASLPRPVPASIRTVPSSTRWRPKIR